MNMLTSHIRSYSSPIPFILPALLLKKVRGRKHCTITRPQWGWIKAPASGWEFQTSLCKQNSFSKGTHIFLCRFREEGKVRMEILIFLHVSEEKKYCNILTCLKPEYFLSHDIKNTIYY